MILWLPSIYIQLSTVSEKFNWLEQYSFSEFIYTTFLVHGIQKIVFTGKLYVLVNILLFGLILWGIYLNKKNINSIFLIICLLLSSFVFPWVFGFIHTPIFMDRTILWGTIFSSLLIGLAFSKINAKIFIIVFFIFITCLTGRYVHYKYFHHDKQE